MTALIVLRRRSRGHIGAFRYWSVSLSMRMLGIEA